ncbi:mechanosensitive ion channel domain-containing protein [Rheinheimera sp.]|uniref:mechanosensitive ion channel domain-containing protein n=1 Tax=Rheinheimera sp. TaxID=1869214 RepID=UPI00262E1DC3|nr:mechanosensitive ion channel domain-containing protein [Rheinheimera sp.]MCA1929617.1 mechanosensitive ion channel family protein [Rheinheimera sp.]
MQEAMQILHQFKELMASFSPAIVQMVISAVIILIYIVLSRRIAPFLYRTIAASVLKEEMNRRALVVFHILLFLLLVVILSVVWGIDIKGLLVLASSMIAVIGVALFAAWSLLSNITAFFIMLGQRNFAPGAEVKIIDGSNHIEGKVVEINLFSTVLLTKNNDQVVYPNNLIVSRPVIVQHHIKVDKSKAVHRWRRRQPDHR